MVAAKWQLIVAGNPIQESQGRIPSSVNVAAQRMWVRDEIMNWIDSSCPSRRVWEKLHPKYRKKAGGY